MEAPFVNFVRSNRNEGILDLYFYESYYFIIDIG